MRFTFHCLNTLSFLLLIGLALAAQPALAESVAGDQIFPDSTKGFISIRNLSDLQAKWRETQIGQLMNEPIMEAFKKDMQKKLEAGMENRFGFTLDSIAELPSGEVAAGMIAIPGMMPGYAITLHVADRLEETQKYLERLEAKLRTNGTTKTVEEYKGLEYSVFRFAAPKQAEAAEATGTNRSRVLRAASSMLPVRQAFYMLKGSTLIITDQQHLLTLLCDRLDDSSQNALADVENYQAVMQRCVDDTPGGTLPEIAWYLEPLDYGESIRVLMQGPVAERRKNKPSIFSVLKAQGFDAVRGIGGTAALKSEDKETIYRIFIYTEKPYRLAMRMFEFPDATDFVPPAWMPPDLARCTMFYVEPLAIFDNFGTLFDALFMQGEEGVWDDIIEGLKEDPNGPQIDLREELISHLNHRVLSLSHYEIPIDTHSENIVVAVELKDGKEQNMVDALKKLFENDPEMQSTKHSTKHGEYVLWHRVPDEDVIQPFGGVTGAPDLMLGPPTTGPARPAVAEKDEEAPVFPSGAITVAKGCLFVGTQQDYLTEILDRLDQESLENISSDAEFKEVDQIFAGLGLTDKPHFLQFFARTDETVRPTYELIREGKMPQSKTLMGILANALFSPESDDDMPVVRQQAIDGTHLPEFDQVKKYFGPTGIYGMSTEDGFFIKGFLLEKKAEKPLLEELKENDEEPKTEEKGEEPKKEAPEKKEPETKKEPVEEAENSDDLEKTKEIPGKVTIDGKPAENVKIVFEPKDEENEASKKGDEEK